MKLGVRLEGRVVGTSSPEQLGEHLDRVMDELLKLKADDPSINATLASGVVEMSVTVDAGSFPEGARRGMDVIRTAIHAAGGATPDWPTELSPKQWGVILEETSIRKTDLVDA